MTNPCVLWLSSGEDVDRILVPTSVARAAKSLNLRLCAIDVRTRAAVRRAAALDPDFVITRFAYRQWGLEAAQLLEDRGTPVLNRASAVVVAGDQAATLSKVQTVGIPVPSTIGPDRPISNAAIVHKLGLPVVVKELTTSGGLGVHLAWSLDQLEVIQALGKPMLYQKFIAEADGKDIRIIILGGRVLVAMRRQARVGEWRANLGLGGVGESYDPSDRESEIAIGSARAVGLDFAGVDLIAANEGPLLLEVNPKPGARVSQITGVDILASVVKYAATRVSRVV